MASRSFELREFFHLALLRHLSARLSGRAWAVKGGVCLRFFHRSPRLSQDMDLDVVSGVRAVTLENAVDSVLESRALLASLAAEGIAGVRKTKPKQTETTQRWKIALDLGGHWLPAKVEFSRRRERVTFATGVPDAALLARYRMPPFAAQHYGAAAMVAQKVKALAAPSRTAVRDLFDLHHLLLFAKAAPEEAGRLLEGGEIEAAREKAASFKPGDFREEVAPYLEEEVARAWEDPAAFERMKDEVSQALLAIKGA